MRSRDFAAPTRSPQPLRRAIAEPLGAPSRLPGAGRCRSILARRGTHGAFRQACAERHTQRAAGKHAGTCSAACAVGGADGGHASSSHLAQRASSGSVG